MRHGRGLLRRQIQKFVIAVNWKPRKLVSRKAGVGIVGIEKAFFLGLSILDDICKGIKIKIH